MSRTAAAIALGALVGIAAGVYVTRLSYVPPHLMHDEVNFALQAHAIATTGRDTNGRLLPVYFSETGFEAGRDPVMIYWTALWLAVQPLSETSVRLPTAVLAVVTVILTFCAVRRWLRSDAAGLSAAALLALTPAYYVNARLALSITYGIPIVIVWIWCVVGALEGRRWSAALAGAMLGLGVYTYLGNAIVMPALLVITLGLLVRQGLLREARWAAGGFLLLMLPLAGWTAFHPDRFANILAAYSPSATDAAGPGDRFGAFWMFFNPSYLFVAGDGRLTNSTRTAGLFPLTFAVLIPLGMYRLWKGDGGAAGRLVAVGFLVAPLATAASGRLEINRVVIAIPFGVLVATAGVAYWFTRTTWLRIAAVLMLVATAIQFGGVYRYYMGPYRVVSAPWFNGDNAAAIAAVLDRVTAETPAVYLDGRTPIERYWRMYVAARDRSDLAGVPTYYDATGAAFAEARPGSLIVCETSPACSQVRNQPSWQIVSKVQGLDGTLTHEVYVRSP